MDILNNGFSMDRAAQLGGGDALWATTSVEDAGWFAASNPAGADPALIEIALPNSVIATLSGVNLLSIDGAVHRFDPGAMDELNSRANVRLMTSS